jgi:hypothetical protein
VRLIVETNIVTSVCALDSVRAHHLTSYMLSAATGIVALLMIILYPVRCFKDAIPFCDDLTCRTHIEQELVHLPVGLNLSLRLQHSDRHVLVPASLGNCKTVI